MSEHASLLEAVQQVQVLHSPRSFNGDGYGWTVCAECRQAWPCATAHAIDRCCGVERHPNGNVKSGPKSWPFAAEEIETPADPDDPGAGVLLTSPRSPR